MSDPFKTHFNHNDFETSDSGNSDFDEEYFRYQPPPIVVSPQDVVIIKASKKNAGNNKNVNDQEASYYIPQNITTIKRSNKLKADERLLHASIGKEPFLFQMKKKRYKRRCIKIPSEGDKKGKHENKISMTPQQRQHVTSYTFYRYVNSNFEIYNGPLIGEDQDVSSVQKEIESSTYPTDLCVTEQKQKEEPSEGNKKGNHKNEISITSEKNYVHKLDENTYPIIVDNDDTIYSKIATPKKAKRKRGRKRGRKRQKKNSNDLKCNEAIFFNIASRDQTGLSPNAENKGTSPTTMPSSLRHDDTTHTYCHDIFNGLPSVENEQDFVTVQNKQEFHNSQDLSVTPKLDSKNRLELDLMPKEISGIANPNYSMNTCELAIGTYTSNDPTLVEKTYKSYVDIDMTTTNQTSQTKSQKKKKNKKKKSSTLTNDEKYVIVQNKQEFHNSQDPSVTPKWDSKNRLELDLVPKEISGIANPNYSMNTCELAIGTYTSNDPTLVEKPYKSYSHIDMTTTNQTSQTKSQKKKKNKKKKSCTLINDEKYVIVQNKQEFHNSQDPSVTPKWDSKNRLELDLVPKEISGIANPNYSMNTCDLAIGTCTSNDPTLVEKTYKLYVDIDMTTTNQTSQTKSQKKKKKKKKKSSRLINDEKNFAFDQLRTGSKDFCVTPNWDSKDLSMLEDEEATKQTFSDIVPKSTIHQSEPMHNLTHPELVQAFIHDRKFLDYPIHNNYELLTETNSCKNSSPEETYPIIVDDDNTIYSETTSPNKANRKRRRKRGGKRQRKKKKNSNDLECNEADLINIASRDQTDLSPNTENIGTSPTTMPSSLRHDDTTHTYYDIFNGLPSVENEQDFVIVQNKQEFHNSQDPSVTPKWDSKNRLELDLVPKEISGIANPKYSMNTCDLAIGKFTSNDPTLLVGKTYKLYVDIDMTTTNQTSQTKSQKKKEKKKLSKLINNEKSVAIDQLTTGSKDFCVSPNWDSKDLPMLEDEETTKQTFDDRVPKSTIHQSDLMHNLTHPELVQAFLHNRKLLDHPIHNYELLTETYSLPPEETYPITVDNDDTIYSETITPKKSKRRRGTRGGKKKKKEKKNSNNLLECNEADLINIASGDQTDLSPNRENKGTSPTTMSSSRRHYDTTHTYCYDIFNGLPVENEQDFVIVQNKQDFQNSRDPSVTSKWDSKNRLELEVVPKEISGIANPMNTCELAIGTCTSNDPTLVEKPYKLYVDIDMTTTNQTSQTKSQKKKKKKKKKSSKLINDEKNVAIDQLMTDSKDFCVTPNWDSKDFTMLEDEEAREQTFNDRVPKSTIHQSELMHNLTYPELVQAFVHDRKLLDYPIHNYELLTETYSFDISSLPKRNKKQKSNKNGAIVDRTVVVSSHEDTNRTPSTPSTGQNGINIFFCLETSQFCYNITDFDAIPKRDSNEYQSVGQDKISNITYQRARNFIYLDCKPVSNVLNQAYYFRTNCILGVEETYQFNADDDSICCTTTHQIITKQFQRKKIHKKRKNKTALLTNSFNELAPVLGCELSTETYSYNPLLETSDQFYLDDENTICFKPKFDQTTTKKLQIENMKENKNKTESIYHKEYRFDLGPLEYPNFCRKTFRKKYPGGVSVLQNQPGIEQSWTGCFPEDFHISSGDQPIQFSLHTNKTKAIKNKLETDCSDCPNHTIFQNTDPKMDQNTASGSLDDNNYKPNEEEHAHVEPKGHSILNRCSELILKVYHQLSVVSLVYSFFKKK